MARQLASLSREELYDLVWQTPLMRLGPQFGVSGTAIAKRCDRLDVPCPPRGYWAKKEAGKLVRQDPLPPQPRARPPSRPLSALTVQPRRSRRQPTPIPTTLDNLHPFVRAWVEKYAEEEKRRRQHPRRGRLASWDDLEYPPPRGELTERDRYRLQATSILLFALEEGGCRVEMADVRGVLAVRSGAYSLECRLVEKMTRPPGKPLAVRRHGKLPPERHEELPPR